MNTDKKPEPKDFPPESPHDLEWGGYNHAKYSVCLNQWEQRNIQKSTQMNTDNLQKKLLEEVDNYGKFCEKLFSVRYNEAKYVDRWYDELFQEYQTIKIRINLLTELLKHNQ